MVAAIPFMLCAIPCIALCKGKGDAHGAGHGNHEGKMVEKRLPSLEMEQAKKKMK